MIIRIYDGNMNFLGQIENVFSLQWMRKYNSCGEFEAHVPVTAYNVQLLKLENLFYLKGKKECGIIESITISYEKSKKEITVKGRFASSYFYRRIIKGTYNFNGRVETSMRELVSKAAIPGVMLGPDNGYTEKITYQATYKNILTYIEKLSQASDIGFRLRPDFDEKKWIFETYKGVDRSDSQYDISRVIFSQKNGDIEKATYSANSKTYANVCYVGGQGEGSARQIEITGSTSVSGLDRREIFINGSDISKENISDLAYKQALIERGNTTLNSNMLAETLEKEDKIRGNYNYPTDYDLGDIVTNRFEYWGMTSNDRVTEVNEVYEHGVMKAVPTFGTPLPSSIDWSDNL